MIICPRCLIEIADRKYHSKICIEQAEKITIEVRQDCKECGTDIVEARYRTFCSAKCRAKWHNRNRREYGAEWKRKSRKIAKDLKAIDTDIDVGVK